MKELFVPYEIAMKLRELGFKENCIANYWAFENNKENPVLLTAFNRAKLEDLEEEFGWAYHICDVPLYQQVIDWFRVNHKLSIEVQYKIIPNKGNHYFYTVYPMLPSVIRTDHKHYNSYYETLKNSIIHAINLIQ